MLNKIYHDSYLYIATVADKSESEHCCIVYEKCNGMHRGLT